MSGDNGAHTVEMAFAVEQARRAGALLTESYERVQRIDYKSKRDVVTDVDFASEDLVIAAIREQYPADAILAEESGHHQRKDPAAAESSGRTWVIDPLDGTVNYANGIPYYCVSIALIDRGRPVVGVILDPARDDLLTASADGPASLNGVEMEASSKDDLGDFVVSLAIIGRGGISRERRLARAIRIVLRNGLEILGLTAPDRMEKEEEAA
jgi:myo-inositol-1(or 4)-monophosphatase